MRKSIVGAVALLGLVALARPALAIDWTLGGGAGVAPDYEGSEDYKFVPLWNLQAKDLYHPDTYVQVMGPKLNSNFLADDHWRLGLSGQYIFARKDVDNNQVDSMRNTDDGLMLGVMGGYDFKAGGGVVGLEADARYDVKDNVGGLLTFRVKYALPRGKWRFNASADTSLASDDYMDEFFGVNASDSAQSGLATYNPDGGFKDVGLNAALAYFFTPAWSLTGTVRYSRLIGDADDSSPVVDVGSENQFVAGALISFHF